jgi:ribonucleoside-triphosphate reductase
VANQVSKTYWLNRIYSPEVRDAHQTGDLHIHDLGLLSVYCVGWDLQDLLESGFCGAPGKVESRPAKHFRTALGQIVNFFYTLQGESAGAQAFSSFDTYLAPFIYYDNLSYEEVKQSLQEFVYNVNVPTRVGFQTPFTNLTMDLKVPKNLAGEPVLVGGERQDRTYGEFQKEVNMINRAFLEVMTEGDAKGRVFTFPIPTYNITSDFDWDDPDLDILWEVTAKYGIPYFANFVNSDLSPDDARSMCCRLRLDVTELRKRGGGLFGANPLTGSIGVVTLNLPRAGYLAKDEQDLFRRLDDLMEIAKTSLETKRKALENFTDNNLYPYARYYLRNIKGRDGSYWNNHFSTIGLVGMNELLENFLGVDIADEQGKEFSMKILDYMLERMQDFQKETGNFYNLEATPAEGTAFRLAKLDLERNPGITFFNTGKDDVPLYSNSTHLPVNHSQDVFSVLDHQDELQCKYTGGTVQHVFVGESVADPESVKEFVRTVCDQYHLPYFTVTPTFTVCPQHGYIDGEHHRCPKCDQETEVYSRVVGYLRPVGQWNDGKRAEFDQRSLFKVED